MSGFSILEFIGAFLGAVLVVILLNLSVDVLTAWTHGGLSTTVSVQKSPPLKKMAKPAEPVETEEADLKAEEKPPEEPEAVEEKEEAIVQKVAQSMGANMEEGQQVFKKKCRSCHTFAEDGKNRVGPNLWGVLGREKASVEGFKYSGVFQELSGVWDLEQLGQFLTSPKTFAPGTKMTFKGLSKEQDRLNILEYLASSTGG